MSVNLHYEDKARSAGFSSVCGVDEAGGAADGPCVRCRRHPAGGL
jgi:ribonuclease HII